MAVHLSAERYHIADVRYEIDGKTREYALKTKVKIDLKRVFKSSDSLVNYMSDIRQQIWNTRCFDVVQVGYFIPGDPATEGAPVFAPEPSIDDDETVKGKKDNSKGKGKKKKKSAATSQDDEDQQDELSQTDESSANGDSLHATQSNEVRDVTIVVQVKDSKHLLVVPYPKYSSSGGFSLRLKGKDTNFAGSMENMGCDGYFDIENDGSEDDENDYVFGINLYFKLPFKAGIAEMAWRNDYGVSYEIGETTPEWRLKTGIEVEIPFERLSIEFDFYQSFTRNMGYEDDTTNSGEYVYYGDDTYFTEYADFAVPIILQKIDNWGNIKYTPSVSIEYNWDFDGISTRYPECDAGDGLMGPVINLRHKISTGRVNWIENFRTGLDLYFAQYVSYNLQSYTFSPGLEIELCAYKAFKYVGLCADIYAFANLGTTRNIGGRLRGIRDSQYFDSDTGDGDKHACATPAAIIFSFDLPIRLFRVYWDRLPGAKKRAPHVSIINFEVQISPFIDFALIKNRSTLTTFSPKDGFLDGGIEILVYPLRWKGIQLRASFGVDLSRKMPFIKGRFNQEWRDQVSAYELSIGIGLQY